MCKMCELRLKNQLAKEGAKSLAPRYYPSTDLNLREILEVCMFLYSTKRFFGKEQAGDFPHTIQDKYFAQSDIPRTVLRKMHFHILCRIAAKKAGEILFGKM